MKWSTSIVEGTKSCGPGAKDQKVLYKQLHKCCENYDNCEPPNSIEAGETKKGFKNEHLFATILPCHCDLKFFDCLSQEVTGTEILKVSFEQTYMKIIRDGYPLAINGTCIIEEDGKNIRISHDSYRRRISTSIPNFG